MTSLQPTQLMPDPVQLKRINETISSVRKSMEEQRQRGMRTSDVTTSPNEYLALPDGIFEMFGLTGDDRTISSTTASCCGDTVQMDVIDGTIGTTTEIGSGKTTIDIRAGTAVVLTYRGMTITFRPNNGGQPEAAPLALSPIEINSIE